MALAAVCAVGLPTFAQTPTSEQLELFRNLTPEQQRALLEQASGSAGGSSGTQSSGARSGVQSQSRDASQSDRAEAERRTRRDLDEKEPLIPVMKPEDTLLVQISVPERRVVKPAPVVDQLQSQPGQMQPPVTGQANVQNGTIAGPSRQYLEPVELEAEERRKLEDLVELIRSRNPYQLDGNANLTLPGFAPIALGGLNETQAMQRLSAEPALLKLEIKVIRLPLAKSGLQGLKRFGYDLFDDAPSTFSPVTNIPVPSDYVVGPDDEFNVQLFGSQNRTLRLVVSRDGTVSFPELGPIRVAELTFNAARQAIEARVRQRMIGVQASVSMGDLRTIRVFVLGEAKQPGSYAVSGLSTMTTALFVSGGVKPIGSLRNIQLKRQGEVVRNLDLYDLLIQGNTRDDAKLLPGDVIFIPPVGPTVSVDGEVKRPAIYELRGETNVGALVRIAGGLTPEADSARGNLVSVDERGRREVWEVAVGESAGTTRVVRNGDILRVSRLRPQIDAGVTLGGFVHRPGVYAWREGLRLTDIVGSVDELRQNADQHYILIRRESGPDRRISVLSADLAAALAASRGPADLVLAPRDQLTVFDLGPGRERIIKPLLGELRLQAELSRPTEVVRVEGKVKVPGEYPLEPQMTVLDLLRAGGNLVSSAYGGQAELARYSVTDGGARQTELIKVDLAAALRGEASANLPLRPFDYLLVKETPEWADQESVTLKGEVRFPGTYPIRRGERLSDLIERAGGLSALAFPQGAAFTRRELKEREQKQLDQLRDRMQSDIGSLSLQAAAANQGSASQALLAGQSLLAQLSDSKAVGRLVIDLPGLMADASGGPKDIVLRNGDELAIPKERQEVTVIGEVQSTTSHLYSKTLKRDDYIGLSGGTTRKADRGRIYIVRANGSVVAEKRSLFARNYDVSVQPGDTIVVPIDTERLPRLPFWQAVTQIIYNLAISVAAINSF